MDSRNKHPNCRQRNFGQRLFAIYGDKIAANSKIIIDYGRGDR